MPSMTGDLLDSEDCEAAGHYLPISERAIVFLCNSLAQDQSSVIYKMGQLSPKIISEHNKINESGSSYTLLMVMETHKLSTMQKHY